MGGQVQTTRESETLTLHFAAGGTVTTDYISLDNKKEMCYFLTKIPSGFNGVLFPVMSDTPDGVYAVAYDESGNLVYADPTSKIAGAWHALSGDAIFPAHYIKFASMTSTGGTAGTAQSAARSLTVMGLS